MLLLPICRLFHLEQNSVEMLETVSSIQKSLVLRPYCLFFYYDQELLLFNVKVMVSLC